jgi:NarL family two-component system response regulator LiaR
VAYGLTHWNSGVDHSFGAPVEEGSVMSIRIALVDDHKVVTRGIKTYLESFPDIQVTAMVSSGEEALRSMNEWQADIIVMDMLMPGGMDGIETTTRINAQNPKAKIIALTASTDEARLMGILRAGAQGYVRKDADPETLLAAVRAVAAGKTFVDPSIAGTILRGTEPRDELTLRESEVLRALAFGRSNKEIANSLSISEETVKTHVGRLFSKLGIENRAQAVVQALKRQVVAIEEL